TVTITNAARVSASVAGLIAGTYVFQLKVTDSHGLSASATVTITVVYPPPVVSAGSNQTINLPTTTGTLTGTATDATGTITSYAWTEVSGPNSATISNANRVSATLSKLIAGTYVFQLKATDSHGLTATATVTIIVNQPPVANAGANQTITLPTNKATLSGSKSTDADGTIAAYSWTRVSGPSTPTITGNKTVTATISGLVAGTYVYQLTVTDNRGATGSATTQIVVKAAGTGSVTSQTMGGQISTAEQQPDSNPTTAAVPAAEKILLFPNPTQGIINLQITSDSNGTMRINIFDMLGRLALTKQTDKPNNYFSQTIDASRLNSGMYTMQILVGQHKRITVKFIKE
ncbi:MAG TPA: T9SS type A sorting domain-containing protein, partial [Puia sp.]|nr:T9SS type A sorting domain-containing protein [Puia sp.]